MSAATDDILVAERISKTFGRFSAVSDVSLRVRRGTIHSLIGPNGAGKTTCFNLLTKFLRPTSGRIYYKGRDITALRPSRVAELGMVRSFQISAVFPDLSVLENVRVAVQRQHRGNSFDFWRSDSLLRRYDARAHELIELVGLGTFVNWRAGKLAYGHKRNLELATTLALEPEFLLLDEPMAGMGPEDVDRTAELIKTIAANRTVLMVEHNLSVVARLSDVITVLARGQVLAEGSYEEVSQDPAVIEAYIGTGHD
ncbi:ABC transporter ATP-binding protein [Amorphus sp. 3PC139-8]|uniref:ABC transporter ATP-binding protein n=1 Tax=Amorphus sp. 3PC139-8 TaxID=2735676 RepID=UPI00345DFBFB